MLVSKPKHKVLKCGHKTLSKNCNYCKTNIETNIETKSYNLWKYVIGSRVKKYATQKMHEKCTFCDVCQLDLVAKLLTLGHY